MRAATEEVARAEVGVLGFDNRSIPTGTDDCWLAGVVELIAWVLHLLQRDEDSRLRVYVEQRSQHQPVSKWSEAEAALRARVPREKLAGVNIAVVDKFERPYMPYADAIANLWGSGSNLEKTRLIRRLGVCCLYSSSLQRLTSAWNNSGANPCVPFADALGPERRAILEAVAVACPSRAFARQRCRYGTEVR